MKQELSSGRRLAIDATNIRQGGGITHLLNILKCFSPVQHGFSQLVVFASPEFARLDIRNDAVIVVEPWWSKLVGLKFFAVQLFLPGLVKKYRCAAILCPGGTIPAFADLPKISICQNMLPFELDRAALFGRFSWMNLKLRLLRAVQGYSFKRSQGTIFLTEYAKKRVIKSSRLLRSCLTVIPHGIEKRFLEVSREEKFNHDNLVSEPFSFLYVSAQLPYKHQLEVMTAVSNLRGLGYLLELKMVGAASGRYGDSVFRMRMELDPEETFIKDLSHVDFEFLHQLYHSADGFIFASSCENLPNILIEAMAASLPIACSNRGPMPEVLCNAGVYFDPEHPKSIEDALIRLMTDPELRSICADQAKYLVRNYSWELCAKDTFEFVDRVAFLNENKVV